MSESEGVDLVGPIQWLQCTLKETKIQSKFRISLLKHSELMTLTGIIISIVVYSLELLIFVIGFSYSQDFGSTSLIALKILCISAMILMSLKFKKNYRSSEFPWIVMIVYIATSFISTVSVISVPSKFNNIQVLQVLFTNLVVTHLWKLTLSYVLLASIFSYTSWICVVFKTPGLEFAIETSAYVTVFFIFNVFAKVVLELQARRSYNLNKFAKKEIRNTEKLLNQMMPPQVLRNLHNDITVTDRHSDVTIIYADISGFTSFCKTKEPIEVVSMLSKLFSTFDHLCVRHNVYKVHTIGDCYVILSFTDGELRDAPTECVNCVEMALDMVKAIKKVNRSKGLSLNMRIGMHTGTVIAGITGTNIVRYDIYGPDNDIANKMESHGCPGKINLSQVTKSLLESQCPGRFDYEFNKIVRYSPTNEDLEAYFLIPMLESDIVAAQD
jgi:class 3 adenylate cyclase